MINFFWGGVKSEKKKVMLPKNFSAYLIIHVHLDFFSTVVLATTGEISIDIQLQSVQHLCAPHNYPSGYKNWKAQLTLKLTCEILMPETQIQLEVQNMMGIQLSKTLPINTSND